MNTGSGAWWARCALSRPCPGEARGLPAVPSQRVSEGPPGLGTQTHPQRRIAAARFSCK